MRRTLLWVALTTVVSTPFFAQNPTVAKLSPFVLPEATGQPFNLAQFQDKRAVVLMFIATRCPVSNAYNDRMVALARDYGDKGVAFVGINSNSLEDPAEVAAHAQQHGFPFPVLKDAGNLQADRFDARVTPEVFLYDSSWSLRYHGRIDDDRSGQNIHSPDLRNALDAVLGGREVTVTDTKAFGCTIKRVAK